MFTPVRFFDATLFRGLLRSSSLIGATISVNCGDSAANPFRQLQQREA
jgi:hypothetical protein